MIKKPQGHAGAFSKTKRPVRRFAIVTERILLLAGGVLLAVFLGAHIHRAVMLRIALHNFEKTRQEYSARSATDEAKPLSAMKEEAKTPVRAIESPDSHASLSLTAIRHAGQVPLAILRIPRIHLEVPVLGGTDEITLNRGVGQIAGTAAPGEKGNIGIAGHRDGFFRNLKDIGRGDLIELQTTSSSATYVVNRILITGADDASVLRSSDEQLLTLVTCYPFHFIGPAPRRFVVQASLK
ncbi:MAG TPA: class D sortase [Pyrinomonadaceae bacterium]|jgi:sortase A|nr:class D sortase [Pyrinomonadaceae bacterium]